MECQEFVNERSELVAELGGEMPASLSQAMIENPRAWETVEAFARRVMGRKFRDEREWGENQNRRTTSA